MGKWSILRNSSYRRTVKSILLIKQFGGLIEMPFGLVNASFSLPEWQAVKILSLHPEHLNRSINILNHNAEKIGQKSCTQNKNLNQRAQRHSNQRSVSLETNEYQLSLKKIVCTIVTERINFRLSWELSFSLPFWTEACALRPDSQVFW